MLRPFIAFGAALLALSTPAMTASASTVTYDFQQVGFVDFPGFLKGSFTGTVDTSGYISQGSLTAFHADFFVSPGSIFETTLSFGLPDLTLFSFSPFSASTFDFAASSATAKLCSGAAAAFGLCGPGGNIFGEISSPLVTASSGRAKIFNLDDTTIQGATLSQVPIPAAIWLFGSALAGIGLFGHRKTA